MAVPWYSFTIFHTHKEITLIKNVNVPVLCRKSTNVVSQVRMTCAVRTKQPDLNMFLNILPHLKTAKTWLD